MNFIDAQTVPLSGVRRTSEGYLAAEAFSVRTGIQDYLGSEVGCPDKQIVRLYRPPEEVFKADSVHTFAHKPITVDHPPGGVSSMSWRKHAVGEVSTEAMRDGERLKLSLVVKDEDAIKLITSGAKRELSAGYQCQIDMTPGTLEDGTPYDGVQRDIRVNHLALVERGRAGNCMIGDSAAWGVTPVTDNAGATPLNPKEVQMDTKTVVLGDKAVRVVAEDEKIVQDHLTALKADNDKLAGQVTALQKQVDDSKMTPEKLQKLVADRALVAAGYKSITGKDADQSLSDEAMRRAAVEAKLGDAVKEMSDDAVAGAFAAFSAKPANSPLRDAIASGIQSTDVTDHANLFALAGVPMKKG